jgi:hypothetical protein
VLILSPRTDLIYREAIVVQHLQLLVRLLDSSLCLRDLEVYSLACETMMAFEISGIENQITIRNRISLVARNSARVHTGSHQQDGTTGSRT